MTSYYAKYQICFKKHCKTCYGGQKPRGHGPYIWKITYLGKRKEKREYIGPAAKFGYLLTLGKIKSPEVQEVTQ